MEVNNVGFDHNKITGCSPFAFTLRKFMFNSLRMWYISLDWYAGKLLHIAINRNIDDFKSLKIFKNDNEIFQNKLADVFKSYHHRCSRCQDCCMLAMPLHEIDCVLYGFKPSFYDSFGVSPTHFRKLLKEILILITPTMFIRKLTTLLRGPEESNQGGGPEVPCWMWTEHGCKYDYGQRPTLCLLFLCRGLVSEMDWASYRQYISASSRYLAFLTRTLKQVAAELSLQQSTA
jgi:hypothetical protein